MKKVNVLTGILIFVTLTVTLAVVALAFVYRETAAELVDLLKPKEQVQQVEETLKRVPNNNKYEVNVTEIESEADPGVVDIAKGLYKLENDSLTKNGIVVLKDIPTARNTISVIGEYLYTQDSKGLIRYNIVDKSVQLMYYDLYDYVVVGPEYLFGFRDGKIYKINYKYEEQQVNTYEQNTIFEVYNNFAVVNTSTAIIRINLQTGEIEDYPYEGIITSMEYDENEQVLVVQAGQEVRVGVSNDQ